MIFKWLMTFWDVCGDSGIWNITPSFGAGAYNGIDDD